MDARPQQEPPLALWAAICIGLLLGAVAIGVVLGGVMPLPYGPAAPVEQYVAEQPAAVQVIAVGVFASAVPLAVYAATAGARLRELGAAVPGAIALTGGTLATGTLGLTGLVGWVLSRPGGGGGAPTPPWFGCCITWRFSRGDRRTSWRSACLSPGCRCRA